MALSLNVTPQSLGPRLADRLDPTHDPEVLSRLEREKHHTSISSAGPGPDARNLQASISTRRNSAASRTARTAIEPITTIDPRS